PLSCLVSRVSCLVSPSARLRVRGRGVIVFVIEVAGGVFVVVGRVVVGVIAVGRAGTGEAVDHHAHHVRAQVRQHFLGALGGGAHGNSHSPGTAGHSISADSSSASPAITWARPASTLPRWKIWWTRGLRKSASSSTTSLPDWATDTARLAASVDLPSLALGL